MGYKFTSGIEPFDRQSKHSLWLSMYFKLLKSLSLTECCKLTNVQIWLDKAALVGTMVWRPVCSRWSGILWQTSSVKHQGQHCSTFCVHTAPRPIFFKPTRILVNYHGQSFPPRVPALLSYSISLAPWNSWNPKECSRNWSRCTLTFLTVKETLCSDTVIVYVDAVHSDWSTRYIAWIWWKELPSRAVSNLVKRLQHCQKTATVIEDCIGHKCATRHCCGSNWLWLINIKMIHFIGKLACHKVGRLGQRQPWRKLDTSIDSIADQSIKSIVLRAGNSRYLDSLAALLPRIDNMGKFCYYSNSPDWWLIKFDPRWRLMGWPVCVTLCQSSSWCALKRAVLLLSTIASRAHILRITDLDIDLAWSAFPMITDLYLWVLTSCGWAWFWHKNQQGCCAFWLRFYLFVDLLSCCLFQVMQTGPNPKPIKIESFYATLFFSYATQLTDTAASNRMLPNQLLASPCLNSAAFYIPLIH